MILIYERHINSLSIREGGSQVISIVLLIVPYWLVHIRGIQMAYNMRNTL